MKGKTQNSESRNPGCLPELQRAFIWILAAAVLTLCLASCIKPLETSEKEKEEKQTDSTKGMAGLSFFLDRASYDSCLVITEDSEAALRSVNTNPLDSNNYRLAIFTAGGVVVYDSSYVGRPEVFYVKAGTYKIWVTSREFSEPDIYPLFGQEQSVKAKKDSTLCVEIVSRQLTGGIRFIQ